MTTFMTHATGVVALSLGLVSPIQRSDCAMRRSGSVASALWAANNLLLGATTAAAMSALSVGWTTTAGLTRRWDRRVRGWSCAVFIAAVVAAGIATWEGWTSLLATSASALATYSMFYCSGIRLRRVMLLNGLLWSYNAWATHSTEQIVANGLGIAAAALGVWRVRRQAKACAQVQAA